MHLILGFGTKNLTAMIKLNHYPTFQSLTLNEATNLAVLYWK